MGRFRALPARALPALLCAALALCMLHSAHAYVGVVRGWGINNWNQIAIPGNLGPATVVRAGGDFTCAIKTSGAVACWGSNADNRATPPAGLGTATALSLGPYHACAIQALSGNLSCWGNNGYGMATPPGNLGPVTAVATGFQFSCAAKAVSGAVACWGNVDGPPADLGVVSALSGGMRHVIALTGALVAHLHTRDMHMHHLLPCARPVNLRVCGPPT